MAEASIFLDENGFDLEDPNIFDFLNEDLIDFGNGDFSCLIVNISSLSVTLFNRRRCPSNFSRELYGW